MCAFSSMVLGLFVLYIYIYIERERERERELDDRAENVYKWCICRVKVMACQL